MKRVFFRLLLPVCAVEVDKAKGQEVTEEFSAGRCKRCGSLVGFEDGVRQDLCLCDPWCERCGRQFMASPRSPYRQGEGKQICHRCIEEEISETFSGEFLGSLSREQMWLLIQDISRRMGIAGGR